MRIELMPNEVVDGGQPVFTARLLAETNLVAEIKDAPREVALRWAEAMRELHGGELEIKRMGICFYCGSLKRNGQFCADCERVFVVA